MPINRSIDPKDVPLVKGMLLRGDPQETIAWYFGVSNSKISEIKNCSTRYARQFANVPPAPPEELPRPGPYLSARDYQTALDIEQRLLSATIGIDNWRIECALANDADHSLKDKLADMELFHALTENELAAVQAELATAKENIVALGKECDKLEHGFNVATDTLDATEKALAATEAKLKKTDTNARQGWAFGYAEQDKARTANATLMKIKELIPDKPRKQFDSKPLPPIETPEEIPPKVETEMPPKIDALRERFAKKKETVK